MSVNRHRSAVPAVVAVVVHNVPPPFSSRKRVCFVGRRTPLNLGVDRQCAHCGRASVRAVGVLACALWAC